MRFLKVIFVALILSFATGCPRTTIHTRTGGEVTGSVEGADRQFVYIVVDEPESAEDFAQLRDAEPQNGLAGRRDKCRRVFRVDRRAIEDIDYPGNVMGTVGIAISVVGAAVMSAGIIEAGGCNGDFCGFAHLFLTAPGAAGVVAGLFPMGIGWSLYANERKAADPDYVPKQGEVAEVRIAPFVSPTEKGASAGLSTAVAW